ncbi:WD repeat-containing protein 18 [Clupea harengus]|uniref:WD repeat-containing protein 18 n=1 Tax=Clupea harengus TaxID=7950 RepID=A0A6P8FR60_CLUHA|nr:WD repeat-containing protein 18 [Clupea harengus]
MGAQARVATASLDQTVKLWEVSSGEMLLSVLFDVSIMSVTLDPCEYFLFCGGSDGTIYQVSLRSPSMSRDKTFQTDNEGNQEFKGHRNLVTCLSVSMDGTMLLSGSHDETVRLWDIQSKQSIRTINHKGPVTNSCIMMAPANMFLPESRPAVPLPRFSRHLNPTEQGDSSSTGMCLRLGSNTQDPEETYLEKADKLHALMCAVTDKSVFGDGENTKVRVSELEEEVKTLKKINKDLYDFSSQLLIKPS